MHEKKNGYILSINEFLVDETIDILWVCCYTGTGATGSVNVATTSSAQQPLPWQLNTGIYVILFHYPLALMFCPQKRIRRKGCCWGFFFFFFFFASMQICFFALLIFFVGRFRTTFLAIELFPLMEMHIMYVMYSCPGFMYSAQKLILNRVVKTVTICIPLFWVVKNISVFSFSCPIP